MYSTTIFQAKNLPVRAGFSMLLYAEKAAAGSFFYMVKSHSIL